VPAPLAGGQVPDEVYLLARQHFSEKELLDLTGAIIVINGWNRIAVACRTVRARSSWTHREAFVAPEGCPPDEPRNTR
jgi:hypothetical protein